MTTIIVVVVVALVFFVSVCVAAFMVWKRESEMRTDSILAIEHNLEKLGATLTDDIGQEALQEETEDFRQERQKERERQRILHTRGIDPFSWMRSDSGSQEEKEISADDQNRDGGTGRNSISAGRTDKADDVFAFESYDPEEYPDDTIVLPDLSIGEDDEYNDYTTDNAADDTVRNFSNVDSRLNEREQIYADIDLDFAEIRNLVSEIRNADTDKDTDTAEISEHDVRETGQESDHPQEREYVPEDISDDILQEQTEPFSEVRKPPISHDVGRSGRKYKAAELDMLIKE